MTNLNQPPNLSGFQGISAEDEDIPLQLREGYVPPKTTPPTPKPEQTQQDKDKEHQRNLFQQATDWVAEEVFQMDPNWREEQREKGRQQTQELNQRIENATGVEGFTRDAIRTVTSGIEKPIQDAIGFGNFVGDFAKTKLGLVDPDDEWNNVDHANYRGSERDLVFAEPRSQAGLIARDMVSFVVMQRQLGRITGMNQLTSGKGLINPQRLAADTALGAMADFIMDPGDGNASNALIEVFPGLEDNRFLSAFAHEDDDNEFTRRLKNQVEGGVMGIAVDAAGTGLSALYKGAKTFLGWMRKNPGKKAIDAPPEIKEAAYNAFYDQLELDIPDNLVSTKPSKDLTAEDVYMEVTEDELSRVNQLNATEFRSLFDDYEAHRFVGRRQLIAAADPDVAMEVLGHAVFSKKLPNGTTIHWHAKKLNADDVANRNNQELQGQNIVRIDWDLESGVADIDMQDPKILRIAEADYNRSISEGGPTWSELSDDQQIRWIEGMQKDGDFGFREVHIGSHGTKLYRQIGGIAKKLKPGTIVRAEAAADGFGSTGLSGAQLRRSEKIPPVELNPAQAAAINSRVREIFDAQRGEGSWSRLDREARSNVIDNLIDRGDLDDFRSVWRNADTNIREKLYQRAGLAAPDENGKMWGIVKYRPNGRKVFHPLDFTKPIQEQVDEAIESARQYELGIDFNSAEVRPGKFDRFVEDYENGGNRFRQDFEPYERASKTSEFPMTQVLAEQAEDSTRPRFTPGGPSPRLTDNTVRQLSEAGGDMEIIQKAVDELYESLDPRLRANDPAVVKEAQDQLAKLVRDNLGEEVDMSALTEVVGEGGDRAAYIQTLLGNVVAKSYIKDLSVQMRDLASEAKEITSTGADANRQYNLLLDRLKATASLQIRDGSRRGSALQSLQIWRLFTNPDTASKAKVANFQEKIEDLRSKLNQGDPKASEELNVIAESMVLADGDADLAMSFGRKWAQMTGEDFTVTLYNSYLSGINTQGRNILGNLSNVFLKPMQIMMGAHQTGQRRSALAMYGAFVEDFYEGLQIARTSFMDPKSTPKRLEGTWQGMDMAEKLDNLRRSAKTPIERGMYGLKWAQYWAMANPWMQGATRLLSATDDGFKVMSARQKLRYDVNMLAIEDGIKFDPQKYEIMWSTKYKNGEIQDPQLIKWAQQDTFQEDLNGTMAQFAGAVNDNLLLKYVVPFVKTPTNIIKQTGHYIPLGGTVVRNVNRFSRAIGSDVRFLKEYDEIMQGSDKAMKAVYRGREAMGTILAVGGVMLGQAGLITGSGPRDPDKRKIWEEAGNQRHSIKIGDTWVSTRFLGPLGILLSAYADLGMVSSTTGAYDNYQELMGQLIYSTAGSLLDQSWAKGLFDTFTVVNEFAMGRRKMDMDVAKDFTATVTRAMWPYQAAFRALNNTLVPAVKEYDDSLEKFWAETVPGMKLFLGHERVSLRSGEPVYTQGYSALNQLVPFGLKEVQEDPLLHKLVDLGIDFPMEMYDKYKGEDLGAKHVNKLNEYFASSGVWEDIEKLIMNEEFDKTVEFWQSNHKGRSRKDAEWYKQIRSKLSEARITAINNYRYSKTPDGNEFDELLTNITQQKNLDALGLYNHATTYQQKLANP